MDKQIRRQMANALRRGAIHGWYVLKYGCIFVIGVMKVVPWNVVFAALHVAVIVKELA